MMLRFAAAVLIAAGAMGAGAAPADPFIHEVPPASRYVYTSDVPYAPGRSVDMPLRFDIYRPNRDSGSDPVPVVVFLNGIGTPWIRKDAHYAGWAKLVTTAGLAGVTFDTEDGAVEQNFDALLSTLRARARSWNIDPARVAVYAASANVTAEVPLIANPQHAAVKAAAIYYGSSDARDFRQDVPLLVVRAGLDRPALNRGLDRLVSRGLAANVPVTVIALNGAHHGFEQIDDDDAARSAMDATLTFFQQSLQAKTIALRAAQSVESSAAAALYVQDWPSAIARYRQLIASQPPRAALYENLGQALEGAGDDRAALTAYRAAIELGTRNVGLVAVASAKLALRFNDRAEALRWLQKIKGDSFTGFRRSVKDDPAFVPLHDDLIFQEIFGR